jgi:hypothetical protein
VKLLELADISNITTGRLSFIFNEQLGLRKLFKMGTALGHSEPKKRLDDSERSSQWFKRNKKGFFVRYVAMVKPGSFITLQSPIGS